MKAACHAHVRPGSPAASPRVEDLDAGDARAAVMAARDVDLAVNNSRSVATATSHPAPAPMLGDKCNGAVVWKKPVASLEQQFGFHGEQGGGVSRPVVRSTPSLGVLKPISHLAAAI